MRFRLVTVRWDMAGFAIDSGEENSYSVAAAPGCERQQIIDKEQLAISNGN
jgi:hypothetical protein